VNIFDTISLTTNTDTRHFAPLKVFVAGPNAGAAGSPTGSTAMTLNKVAASGSYEFFRAAVKAAMSAGLDAWCSF
jgi:hypothetical protein